MGFSRWDETGPKRHSAHDLITGYAADDPGTIEMKAGASDMSDPLGCCHQRIQLRRVAFNQKESVQVASVRVEKYDIEGLNCTLLLKANQVTHELLEVLRAHLFPAWNGPIPTKQHDV